MKEITQNQFTQETSSGNVVVMFSGATCPNCKIVERYLVDIQKTRPDIAFIKVNTTTAPELVTKFNIMSLPTLVFLKDNKSMGELVSLKPKPLIEKKLVESFG